VEQLRQNASALGWELTADEIAAVDRITARFPGHLNV
jgi:aryl-alcohol dehydrogenase-like predicted oxidoreductase